MMAAIQSVLPQIPKALLLPGTSLAAHSLEIWSIWSLGSSPGPEGPIWTGNRMRKRSDYMMAGQKSSLDAPPITQPFHRHGHGAQDGWYGGWMGPRGAREDGGCGSPDHSIPTILTESTMSCSLPRTGMVGPCRRAHCLGGAKGECKGRGIDWDLSFTSCPVWGKIIKNI